MVYSSVIDMMHTDLRLHALIVVLILCAITALIIAWRRWQLSLLPTLAIALAIRLLVACLAKQFTPADTASVFHNVGIQISQGKDPTLSLPDHDWNFLPMMSYIWAALTHINISWVYVVKIPAIICDVINVWLIGLLDNSPNRATRRLLYAVSPVAIIVTSLHGQVEPIALSLLLAGIILYRKKRDIPAGILFGLAIASKTWPVLAVFAVLFVVPLRRAYKIILPAIIVLACFFVSSIIFLSSPPLKLAHALISYSSIVGYWGWAGAIVSLGHTSFYGGYSPAALPGDMLIAIAVVVAMLIFRKSSDIVRAWTALAAMQLVTPGFGVQYLLWFLPIAIAAGESTTFFTISATGYMLVSYLPIFTGPAVQQQSFVAGLSWVVIASIGYMLRQAYKRERGQKSAKYFKKDKVIKRSPLLST